MNPIKLFTVDDHPVFLAGLRFTLSDQNVEIIGEAANGSELLNALEFVTPDAILLDLRMPVMDGVEATRIIRKLYPELRILIISYQFNSTTECQRLLDMGVSGLIGKGCSGAEIYNALVIATSGGQYFCPEVQAMLSGRGDQKVNSGDLSKQEIRVLTLLCKQKTNAQIAQEMNLSVRTVENYRFRLVRKMNVKNARGLVLEAARRKLIDLEVQGKETS